MKLLRPILLLCLALPGALSPTLFAAETKLKKVLFFTKCSNYEHSVVHEIAGKPSFAAQVLLEYGAKHGIEFTLSKDGSKFSPEYLAQFDAYFFFTSGDLSAIGKDGNPPISAAGKQALLDAIKGGKGFIGSHAAADTYHPGETAETNTSQPRTWRYRNLGDKTDPYTRMLGAEFIIHGTQTIARAVVVDPKFPGLDKVGAAIERQEEWYSLTDFSEDLHVLLVMDTSSVRNPYENEKNWPPAGWNTPYQRPPYPNTWARMHSRGRVFYTSLAHREDTWLSPEFQSLLFGGVEWALGRREADVTPNIRQVTPKAWDLPPVSAPVPGVPPTPNAK